MALSKPNIGTELLSSSERERICDACKTGRDVQPAVKHCLDCNLALCQTCVDYHRRFKQLKDHKIVVFTNEAIKLAEFLSNCLACSAHPDQKIELLCKDHAAMFCVLCASCSHRSCRNIVDIASEATGAHFSISFDIPHLINKLQAAKDHMKEIIKVHKKHNETIQNQIEVRTPYWLQKLRTTVLQALTRIEQFVLEETKAKGFHEINKGNVEVSSWESYTDTVDNAANLLGKLVQNGSDVHAYVAVNHVKQHLDEIDKKIHDQGDKVERLSLEFKEGEYLKCLCKEQPRELVDQSIKPAYFQLHRYKHDQLGQLGGYQNVAAADQNAGLELPVPPQAGSFSIANDGIIPAGDIMGTLGYNIGFPTLSSASFPGISGVSANPFESHGSHAHQRTTQRQARKK